MNWFLRQSAFLTAAIALVLTTAAVASAQQLIYDANEGGWVDTEQGLVWGHDYAVVGLYPPPGWGGGWVGFPPDYVSFEDAETLAANYPAYLAMNGWYDAADLAAYWESLGYAWRQPTLKEAQSAWKRGFSNVLGDVPGGLGYYSLEYHDDEAWEFRWTSTTTRKKVRGEFYEFVRVIYLSDGFVEWREANALGFPLFVRPLAH